jgi:hypothetical protein
VEGGVQALLKVVDNSPHQRIRPCYVQKLINYLKLRRTCGTDDIPNKNSNTFQGDHWYTSHTYLITAFGCLFLQNLGRKQNPDATETREGPKILSKFTSD